MHGKGEYIIKGCYIYIGEFENDEIHGEGECRWNNGKKYIGSWANN